MNLKLSLIAVLVMVTVAVADRAEGQPQAAPTEQIVLATDDVTHVIGRGGTNLGFRDNRSGKNYCDAKQVQPLAALKKGTRYYPVTRAAYATGRLSLSFEPPGITVVVKVVPKRHYFVWEVESISDPEADELRLVNLPVTCDANVSGISGVAADSDFAVCLRILNLRADAAVGGRPAMLAAICSRRYGVVGTRLALVGCPSARLRDVLKEVVREEGIPYSPMGGPFALDAPENRGSYVFADVSEKNVDQWIAIARQAGLAQVHLCGWEQSLGHYEPRKDLFPNGLAGLKVAVEKIHAAGLRAGMHILTGCISVHDPWATPVPDRRLATDAHFTLAAALDAQAKTVLLDSPPPPLDTIWAYSGGGNAIRVDDELIQFRGLSRRPPYAFTDCLRGAFGTKPQAHAKGAGADHMFVRYTSFQPDENSTLVDDLAAAVARPFNACGFDMIYMDGAEGMMGGWHGVATMRAAIFRKINRGVLVEASQWGYHSWPFHSRIGAWDYPNWGLKPFIDLHCRSNEEHRRSTLLAAQLGWWAILGPGRDHPAEFPDEIEYLCGKALGYDMSMSFEEIHAGARPANARQSEYLTLIGRYERLRLSGQCPETVRQRLRQEKAELHLAPTPDGKWQWLPVKYAAHKVTGPADGTGAWSVENPFAVQPLKLRIEALYSAESYDNPSALVLADGARPEEFTAPAQAAKIEHALTCSRDQVKIGDASLCYRATNAGASPRGAWAKVGKTFAPHVDLQKCDALGVWVHGDGKGALLNLQLTNPPQYWPTCDEHYVKLDFTGWRYFELLLRERDAEQYGDYAWPYGDASSVYRSPLIRDHLSGLNLYLNELPPKQPVTCYLSPIKALPTMKIKLRNPSITVGGRQIVFPTSMESGSYLELNSAADCKLYDEHGQLLRDVRPETAPPQLACGSNSLKFTCEGPQGFIARVKVTVITYGEPIGSSSKVASAGASSASQNGL